MALYREYILSIEVFLYEAKIFIVFVARTETSTKSDSQIMKRNSKFYILKHYLSNIYKKQTFCAVDHQSLA